MSLTSQLLDQLRNHYIEPGAISPGGVFAGEVGINGNWGDGRRCDALYAGFTSQSGRILIGHELKVSRSDWNHERAQLDKADQWADQCHAWYLVAPSVAIIPAEEVPAGWGLMVPDPRAKRRFKIVVKATIHKDRIPSWSAVRSFMARMDTLAAQNMNRTIAERVERDVATELERQRRYSTATTTERDLAKATERLAKVEQALGVKIDDWDHRDVVSADTLAAAIDLVQKLKRMDGQFNLLQNLTRQLDDATNELGKARAATTALLAHVPKVTAA